MFSYPAGLLQMTEPKRAENHFNGVAASSSGEPPPTSRQPPFAFGSGASPRLSREGEAERPDPARCRVTWLRLSGEQRGQENSNTASRDIPWTDFVHRTSGRASSRWNGQQPHHQAKQDYGRNQGKQRVQRMKMEVRIPRQPVLRRQHRTSFARDSRANGATCLCLFLPPLGSHRACFFWTP
jgi:hypothetical protein